MDQEIDTIDANSKNRYRSFNKVMKTSSQGKTKLTYVVSKSRSRPKDQAKDSK